MGSAHIGVLKGYIASRSKGKILHKACLCGKILRHHPFMYLMGIYYAKQVAQNPNPLHV